MMVGGRARRSADGDDEVVAQTTVPEYDAEREQNPPEIKPWTLLRTEEKQRWHKKKWTKQ